MGEPKIHYVKDQLDATHPLAYKSLECTVCREAIHAFNNECMQPWVESGKGNYCLLCFTSSLMRSLEQGEDETKWGIPLE